MKSSFAATASSSPSFAPPAFSLAVIKLVWSQSKTSIAAEREKMAGADSGRPGNLDWRTNRTNRETLATICMHMVSAAFDKLDEAPVSAFIFVPQRERPRWGILPLSSASTFPPLQQRRCENLSAAIQFEARREGRWHT